MAGFALQSLDNKSGGFLKRIQKNIRYLSFLGMKYEDKLMKQSKAVGIAEAEIDSMYNLYHGSSPNYMGLDYGQKEFIAFFDKEYPTRRDFLRKFAMNGEIEHVLEVITDEAIVYDDRNYFGYPATKDLKSYIKEDKAKEIVDDLNEAYKKVYFAFGFNKGHDAWHYFKKFLIDGFLAFEIIYDGEEDEEAKNIIGFKELDPISLEPEIRIDEDGNEYRLWYQYKGDSDRQRELLDANLIYISWARGNFIGRLSYVERLVRSFNMLRTLENSRIIWNVWNSQYRMKVIVPIGSQSETKARTRLSELRGMYKEELNIDEVSGEITYNGSPQFNFAKTFIVPSKNGEQTEIDSMKAEGYDLSDTESLKYFWKRFIMETKVPTSRFSNSLDEAQGENWGTGEGIQREEVGFANFINRIQSMFQEIIVKPTWYQFVLKHPHFAKDQSIQSIFGITFNEENLYKIAKERDLAEKGAATVTTLMGVTEPTVNPDGTPGETKAFDTKFLVEKFMDFSDADMKLNEKYKKERDAEIKKLAASYARINAIKAEEQGASGGGFGGDEGGFGGGGFGDLGGGDDLGGGLGGEDFGDLGGGDLGGDDLGGDLGGGDEGGEL